MTDPRPSLFVNDPLDELILDVWSALNASNDPPWLFRTGGFLSHLKKDDGGLRQSIDMLNIDKLRPKLAEVIAWWRRTRQGTVRAHAAPDTLTRSLLALPVDGLPALQIITESPVLLPDGTIVRERGYYASGKLVYDPVPGFELPEIPLSPTPKEVAAAVRLIREDLLADFPFVGNAEQAHAFAMMLQPFVRPLIRGATPMYMVDAPSPRTGKTLLVMVSLLPYLGMVPAATPLPDDDAECRKKITAVAAKGETLLWFDNIKGKLDHASLMAAISQEDWTDRVLGHTLVGVWPIRWVWAGTANNALIYQGSGRPARPHPVGHGPREPGPAHPVQASPSH